MPKAINLGNGKILVGLDRYGQVKDLYYHYPGLENHVSEKFTHKIGVWVEDQFSWFDDGSWEVVVSSEKDTMSSSISAKNSKVGLEITISDVVYNEKNIFIREILTKNLFERKRLVKIFFNQQFKISQTYTGDTAYYDPRDNVVIHYKGRRVFLVNARTDKRGISEYSVGLLGIEGKDGTYKDAEDGKLSGNAIEHGQVDSVISLDLDLASKGTVTSYYWICISKSIVKAKKLNDFLLARGAEDIIKTTKDYWKAWVNVQNFSFYGLNEQAVSLFKKSLLYIRTHVSNNGGIIASGDSDLLQYGRDTYAYVWPRDAAFVAIALEKAGDFNASRRFFRFANDIIMPDGYFMHKYRPDKSLGSSWHPWVSGGQKHLPIQEDETALVIYALWEHYQLSRDLEFIEEIYNNLIKSAAEFMVSYRDEKTGLPAASYDLWEQVYGVHTFTAASVSGALTAASKFAKLLGKELSSKKYRQAAEDIKKAIMKYLYNAEEGVFYKLIATDENSPKIDTTLDMSSFYGIYKFEILPVNDPKLKIFFDREIERLEVKTEVGGIARYEGDAYHHKGGNIPGNPWVVTTMWKAQYLIDIAKGESDMDPVRKLFSWAVKFANTAGILPEQFDPYTGEHISASPLTWSHAEYVTTIIKYLEKLEELGVCKACYPIT